jgi:acetyltransferase-like isoleucine patch superfamily enzyme
MLNKLYSIWLAIGNILSFFMKAFLRMNGAKIGRNVYISITSKIYCSKLIIDDNVSIESGVRVNAREMKIGSGVIISEKTQILGGGDIEIGKNSYIGKNAKIDISCKVTIGRDVGFGEFSVLYTHASFLPTDEGYLSKYEPVTIGDNCWLTTNVIILPGVSIGSDVVASVGSVVMKDVEAGNVVMGNPARVFMTKDKMKNEKSFAENMKDIITEFNYDGLPELEAKSGYEIFKYKDFEILIFEDEIVDHNPSGKFQILLAKTDKEYDVKKGEFLFNFKTRERQTTNNKIINSLNGYFGHYGIRFTLIY